MITEYTTFNDVRAALGVSDEEIDDATLALRLYDTQLQEELYAVHPTLATLYLALPEDLEDRTPLEARFGALVNLFATYSVAWAVLTSVEMFGYSEVADGRASTKRENQASATLRANLAALLGKVRAKLVKVLVEYDPTIPAAAPLSFGFVSAVGLAVDPVTG